MLLKLATFCSVPIRKCNILEGVILVDEILLNKMTTVFRIFENCFSFVHVKYATHSEISWKCLKNCSTRNRNTFPTTTFQYTFLTIFLGCYILKQCCKIQFTNAFRKLHCLFKEHYCTN